MEFRRIVTPDGVTYWAAVDDDGRPDPYDVERIRGFGRPTRFSLIGPEGPCCVPGWTECHCIACLIRRLAERGESAVFHADDPIILKDGPVPGSA